MEKNNRPPVDWDKFKKEAKIISVPPKTLGRARDDADIRPPGRVGNRSKQGAAKPIASGRAPGNVS